MSRQDLRVQEIVAIEKATEIMSGSAVSGSATKHLPSLMQTGRSALAQLRADAGAQAQVRAADFLHAKGKELNSRVLSALAARARADPFAKVKKMIKDLIVQLQHWWNHQIREVARQTRLKQLASITGGKKPRPWRYDMVGIDRGVDIHIATQLLRGKSGLHG